MMQEQQENGSTNAPSLSTEQPWGAGRTQEALMESDTVLVLDRRDNIIGSASKKESHVLTKNHPHGILHRAFSVFLFDESDGRLLIHQRAHSKITFPNVRCVNCCFAKGGRSNFFFFCLHISFHSTKYTDQVWTNTCCSHPLHGMTPSESELDVLSKNTNGDTTSITSATDIMAGKIQGVKHAAVRKLQHELGIPMDQLLARGILDRMKFLTRLHYWAADTVTHGTGSPWGEHEIDYVLFMTVQNKNEIHIQPNPEEIDAIRWVNSEELEQMLKDSNNLFSPWFRLIYYKWLKETWWKDLKETMNTDKCVDYETIHEFDPPVEHFGGAGNAGPLFLQGDGR
jgi:isopentenyl-diphosphate delta-isomerase